MASLQDLQARIESLHGVSTRLDVREFVVDDAARKEIPGAREGLPEQLFIREAEQDLELALYVAPQVMQRLQTDDPEVRLHGGNLDSYCVALEGVSHFVLVVWRASIGRPVSALEMELQAEVDKFVTAWLLLDAQGQARARTHAALSRQLFECFELREDVPTEESDRYHVANRAAQRYCRRLANRYAGDRDTEALTRDVRAFYRSGLAEKLRIAA